MDISAEIAAIQAASQGSELRQPLVGALNKLNSGSLPAVTTSDVGKILKVGANGWEVGEKSGYMPVPTAAKQITENGTHDVTDYASAVVNVSGGGGSVLIPKTITQNGTYDPAVDNADGYSSVIVNVSGGGSGTCEYLTLNTQSIVTNISGQCVIIGQQAILDINIWFSSTQGTKTHILTIPERYRPAGYYLFKTSNGGNVGSNINGEIYPDGKIYVDRVLSYLCIHAEWIIAKQSVQVNQESNKINSLVGDIAINGNFATLSCIVNMSYGSNAWENLISIPQPYRPSVKLRPSVIAAPNTQNVIRDGNYSENSGIISMWRSGNNYDNDILIMASWIIDE